VDILNECEIVGTLRIFIKSKKLVHYYTVGSTHTHMHTHTHTHTHMAVLRAWGEISTIAEILGLPKCANSFMSQNNHPP
jgi:hypothetical protein